MADVTFKGVWKVYLGRIEAVKELDLDIKDGERDDDLHRSRLPLRLYA